MKQIVSILFAMLAIFNTTACNNTPKSENIISDNDKELKVIEVYYFHYTRRCITCNAVEKITLDALKEYFAKEVDSGKIVFKSINLDDKVNEALAEKLKISGQTLMFIAGNNKINLTNDGFMYAKNNPDKLKAKVKSVIDKMMK
ncbi:MAG: hypothetical protein JXR51_04980 [Bacteroidales bacterium]|nr:hypothetical protein [Bacteroidales bacterium]MBN2756513.1 hypothetical protein [Bacteroidales bacterium]